MKLLAVTVLLSISACVYGGPTARVVGGKDAAEGQYSYQVQLIHIGLGFACGGSILSKRYILTAAHCLAIAQEPSEFQVIVGTTKRGGENGAVYQVDSFVAHEDYTMVHGAVGPVNDIGLLHLAKDIRYGKNVQPVKLPSNANTFENDVATLTGWGSLKIMGQSPINLQEIQLKVLDSRTCNQTWVDFVGEKIDKSKICTTSRVGQGACHGDSGGPLVLDGTQIGIVSYGWPCGTGVPDVFTRVSSYLDWIKKHSV
ncbi:chymotrypsin-2-like [Nasonia vitripennis]|uniref:chymotrypsin n=1 Tax=Nasonia vitripennis TaxID=7425 RepID=A0A7M7INF0_NASVI|nr:chymotrypsin-2-like [Nasonia vitripennis]